MRCSATVVLPEPAPPWMTTMPELGWAISSNCSLSISAAISGRALSARTCGPLWTPRVHLPPRGGHRHRPGRLADAAVQHRRQLADRLLPVAARVAHERALRRADAAQLALVDGHVAPDLDHALDPAAGDLLLVVVALLVPVVHARHRGVAPVDDLHAGRAIDEAALADHDVAGGAVLLEAQVREVRRVDVHRQRLAAAEPAAQRRQPGHLLDQRRQVLAARLGDLVAQRQQVAVEVGRAQGRLALVLVAERHPRRDLREQALLVGHDLRAGAAGREWFTHEGWALYPNRPVAQARSGDSHCDRRGFPLTR